MILTYGSLKKMGYFKEMNLDVTLQPGPTEALAVTKLVGEKQADIGFPSPGVLLSSVDAGIPVILVWEMAMKQVFDFALPADSPITRVQELAGKTIALVSEGWRVIVDPILVEAGVDPKHVTYLNAGPQWGQAVALGRADAGLTWRGLAAQWMALGLKLKFLVGTEFSGHPSNGYAIRREDLEHDARIDIWRRFFRANCMAFEFTRANPRAAARLPIPNSPPSASRCRRNWLWTPCLNWAPSISMGRASGKATATAIWSHGSPTLIRYMGWVRSKNTTKPKTLSPTSSSKRQITSIANESVKKVRPSTSRMNFRIWRSDTRFNNGDGCYSELT